MMARLIKTIGATLSVIAVIAVVPAEDLLILLAVITFASLGWLFWEAFS
jgi:hypothetical protein